jgi:hypothetical protein
MPAFPHTTGKSHGSFESGDTGLNPGPEASKTMANIFTAAHIGFFKSALFGKTDIFDVAWGRLGLFQILFGCKTTVKTDLERISAIDFLLPVQHWDCQIDISRLALLFIFGIHNGQHPAFGPSVMVAELRYLEPEFIPAAYDKPREHPHAVAQQGRIPWLVNIGFNAGAIGSHLAALFDAFLVGIFQDVAVDHLPGLNTDGFDIAVQGGFLKPFFGHANAAEPAQALRVDDVKGQFFICESEKNFDDDTAQHLFGAHAFGASALGLELAPVQILQNMLADGRVGIDDTADHFQLLALGMIENVGHQRHLFWPFFAHFEVCSFSVFVVLLIVWRLLIYYKTKRIATAKCAFFMSYR